MISCSTLAIVGPGEKTGIVLKDAKFIVLGIALLFAALLIGTRDATLVEGSYNAVTCGAVFGGEVENATESGESSCAVIVENAFNWTVALGFLGIGLLTIGVSGALVSAQRRNESDPVDRNIDPVARNTPPTMNN